MVVMFSTVVSFINKCSFRSYKFDKVDTFSSKLTTLAWIKERGMFMCSALSSAHGLKNEVYSCVVGFLRPWERDWWLRSCVATILEV